MVNGDDIAAHVCNDFRNQFQLTRLVEQFNVQHAGSAGHQQATLDDTGQNRYINITAGYQTNGLFALNRHFVEHCSSNGSSSSPFCNQLLAFNQSQNCSRDFVICNGYDFIHILADILEGMFARFFHGNAVCNGGNVVEAFNLAVPNGVPHTRCTACLNPINLDIRVEVLDGECNAGNQTAAADWNNNGFHIWHLF